MYSLVLVMAMSHGAAAPGWQSGEVDLRGTNFIHATAHQHYRGRRGCGCGGGCYGGGCYGGYGCCGGGYGGGWGCCGGGYGGGYGCCGGGYGGCYGGGYAWGGSRGGYGGYASYAMPYGYGGYATGPAYGGYQSGYFTPGMTGPGSGVPVNQGTPGPEGVSPPGGTNRGTDRERGGTSDENRRESMAPAPATLIVTLPANASLKVDDYTSSSTAATRTFVSPPLDPSRVYHYTLTAELRNGAEPVTVNKRVEIRAGETTRVNLEFPSGVARK